MWIIPVGLIIIFIVLGAIFWTEERTEALKTVLTTPLSEVKFWHFLLGMGVVVAFFAPKHSSKK